MSFIGHSIYHAENPADIVMFPLWNGFMEQLYYSFQEIYGLEKLLVVL